MVETLPSGDVLTRAMVDIGMQFGADPDPDANIEDTIVAASVEGMDRDDLRVLAVLVTWLDVHSAWINADRLTRATEGIESARVRAFWSAFAHWKSKDRRFARLSRLHEGKPLDLLTVGGEFQMRRRGEDPRFAGSALRVPDGVLRDRSSDVLSPGPLAVRHRTYRYRVQMGPTYRADMWALLDSNPALIPAELARRAYGSFATAWQVKRDFELLAPSSFLVHM